MARKAHHADIDVELHVTIRVIDGEPAFIRRSSGHVGPASLTRPFAKDEFEPGQDNEWMEGGIAILSPSQAPNGRVLESRAEAIARAFIARLKGTKLEES